MVQWWNYLINLTIFPPSCFPLKVVYCYRFIVVLWYDSTVKCVTKFNKIIMRVMFDSKSNFYKLDITATWLSLCSFLFLLKNSDSLWLNWSHCRMINFSQILQLKTVNIFSPRGSRIQVWFYWIILALSVWVSHKVVIKLLAKARDWRVP